MSRAAAMLVMISLMLLSCTSQEGKADLTIACAASAQFAVRDLADQFSEIKNLKIDVIAGSSGRLTTQLMNGAPFDIFFSADMSYPKLLFEKGLCIGDASVYAKGVPVFWTSKKEYDLSRIGWLLQMDKINKVAIADPKNAPYGAAAIQFFKDQEWLWWLERKFVYGESISQVNEYILSENADIGVTAKSIVSSPKLKGIGKYLAFSQEYWIPQGLVAMKNENGEEMKTEFLQFVLSNQGKGILKKYGFAF